MAFLFTCCSGSSTVSSELHVAHGETEGDSCDGVARAVQAEPAVAIPQVSESDDLNTNMHISEHAVPESVDEHDRYALPSNGHADTVAKPSDAPGKSCDAAGLDASVAETMDEPAISFSADCSPAVEAPRKPIVQSGCETRSDGQEVTLSEASGANTGKVEKSPAALAEDTVLPVSAAAVPDGVPTGTQPEDEHASAPAIHDMTASDQKRAPASADENAVVSDVTGQSPSGQLPALLLDATPASGEQKPKSEDEAKLKGWLKEHGYTDVNGSKRTRLLKHKYPLHTAVKNNDVDAVQMLLHFGSCPANKNSSGLTPAELAVRSDKDGSCAAVIASLPRIR